MPLIKSAPYFKDAAALRSDLVSPFCDELIYQFMQAKDAWEHDGMDRQAYADKATHFGMTLMFYYPHINPTDLELLSLLVEQQGFTNAKSLGEHTVADHMFTGMQTMHARLCDQMVPSEPSEERDLLLRRIAQAETDIEKALHRAPQLK